MLRPYLEGLRDRSFPDPVDFKTDEEYLYAAKTTSVFTKVIAELLSWIETHEQEATRLKAKQDSDQEDSFAIGGGE